MSQSSNEQMRLFYGIYIPQHLRGIMGDVQKGLAKSHCSVKWVEAENIHITLRFIGDTPQSRVSEYADAGRRAASTCMPFDMELCGVGAFPHPKRPKTLWVGVGEGAAGVKTVYERLSEVLENSGLAESEDRPYVPHCTVGRVRSSRNIGRLTTILTRAEDADIGTMRCDGFTLIASKLSSSGPTYTPLERFVLGENADETTEES
ncbi:MAG: RNA 2',3'-cyclic phosphodiesterase [Armatimonadota bacterium]